MIQAGTKLTTTDNKSLAFNKRKQDERGKEKNGKEKVSYVQLLQRSVEFPSFKTTRPILIQDGVLLQMTWNSFVQPLLPQPLLAEEPIRVPIRAIA